MVFLPSEHIIRHVSTPADMAEVLGRECSIEVSSTILQATEVPAYAWISQVKITLMQSERPGLFLLSQYDCAGTYYCTSQSTYKCVLEALSVTAHILQQITIERKP